MTHHQTPVAYNSSTLPPIPVGWEVGWGIGSAEQEVLPQSALGSLPWVDLWLAVLVFILGPRLGEQ